MRLALCGLVLSLLAVAPAAHANTCDLIGPLPSRGVVPSGCPITVYRNTEALPELPLPPLDPPRVEVIGPHQSPSITRRDATMFVDHYWCAREACLDGHMAQDVPASRYDITFARPLPPGTSVEISDPDGVGARRVTIEAPGPCPEQLPPQALCALPQCEGPDVPEGIETTACGIPDCGGVPGCNASGATASPFAALALMLWLARRRA